MQEKLACFQQLGIEPYMLPRRIYAGQAMGLIQYFPLRMPVAVGREVAVFVYIDPGMGIRTELHSWGAAHRALWEKFRESGRRIELVAVAWEQHLLDRAERVFQSWHGRAISDAEKEILTLQLAVDNADWDTLEPCGGLDATMRKIHQFEQLNPNFNGPGMITALGARDRDFRNALVCRSSHGISRGPRILTTPAFLTILPWEHEMSPRRYGVFMENTQ